MTIRVIQSPMPQRRPLDATQELLEAFDLSVQATEYLVGVLPSRVWRAVSPVEGRSVAAIVAHTQSVRRTFAKMGGAEEPGASLDRNRSTLAAARRALSQSRDVLTRLFRSALEGGEDVMRIWGWKKLP